MPRTIFCLTVLLLLWFHAPGACAETNNDIKLIIDVSGSMKKNDPDNLRRPAVNLLMNLLPEHTHAGVWLFGDKIETLVPYGPVTSAFKAEAIARSQQIHSKGLLTDIGGALETAMLQEHIGGKAILLSDGMVDIGPESALNEAEQNRIQRELIPKLQSIDAEVHTVALSDNADKEVLEAVALGTGGLFEVARTADDLTRIFLRLFDDAVIQDRLPMDNGRFLVDSSVEEFTLLAFRSADSAPAQIKSPDDLYYLAGDHPDFVSWYQDAGFDLITIKKPLEGEWRLFSDEDPQNRVTVLSDLKLEVSNLGNMLHEASFPVLEIRFLQDTKVIEEPTFLELMDLQLVVLTPSGKRIAKPLTESLNGVYSTDLGVFAEPGRYRVSVNVDGKTFQREVVQEIEYGSPARVVFSETERTIRVRPVAVGLLSQDLRMIARLEDSDDKKRLLPMQSTGEVWQVDLTDYPDGEYLLSVHVKGVASTGQPLDFILGEQTITLKPVLNPLDTEETLTPENWGAKEWSMAAAVGLGNLFFISLLIWMYRRRGSDNSVKEAEAEVSELLEQTPKPDDTSDADVVASLAEAEAMREQAELPETEEIEPAGSGLDDPETQSLSEAEQETNEPQPVSGSEGGSDQESSLGGLSDIVDAWDSDKDLAVTPDESEAIAEESLEEIDAPEPKIEQENDLELAELAETPEDDDLMDEFERAVNEQLEADELAEVDASESIDESAQTVVLDESPDLEQKDASSSR